MLIDGENHDIHEEQYKKFKKSCDRYRYKVFGLHIATDILLPELLPDNDTKDAPEVNINFGKIPTNITDDTNITKYWVIKNQFLLKVPEVGCYCVTNGNQIIVDPAEQADVRIVRIFLLGTAFGALLMQRGILPIHGSTVVIDGRCVIFTGISGAGKSTLLAAFRDRGYSFLTDDVAAVTVDANGVAWVHPAYPQQKLWRDSAETLRVDITSLTPFFTGMNRDKFSVPVYKGFCQSAVPLTAVYELEMARGPNVTIKRLEGRDKLSVLINNTYRPWLIDALEQNAAHFKQCVAVASQITVSRLTRLEDMFSLEELVRLVQQDLLQLLADRAV